jgi:hypothetical protein
MTVVSPVLAEKLFLSAFVLLLPLAFRSALGAIRPEARDLWPLVLPFVYSHFLHLGFYNLAFAAVPFFVVLGYWSRRGGRLGPRETGALALLLLLLYFCHLVTFLLALGALGLLAAAYGLGDLRGTDPGRWTVAGTRVLALTLAALPSLFLALRFLASQRTERSEDGPSFLDRWGDLWRITELSSHDERELWLSSALGLLLLAVAALLLVLKVRRGDWRPADAWLAVVAGFACAYFLAPVTALKTPGSTAGGGTTHDRVSLYVYLALLVWVAAQDLAGPARQALVAASLVLFAGLVGLRLPRYAEMNDGLAEYRSIAPSLDRHATLLPLSFAHQGRREDGSPVSWRVSVFLHGGAYLALERALVDFTNYEADLGYFPTLFRHEANPYRWLRGGQETAPPCMDLDRYDRRGIRPLDYVVLWGVEEAQRRDACVAAVLKHLDARYELVRASEPRGLAQLYRRKAGLPVEPRRPAP